MPHLPQNGLRVPSNIKFVPTANVLDYGEDLALHLTTAGLSEKSITFSSAAITRSTDDSGQPLDAIPHVYSDTDTGLILHEGNDTTFNESYVFNSDMPAVIYKVSINVCMGLSVSAYSSGNFNLGNLIVTITSEGASTKNIYTNTFASGATTTTATGVTLHWFTVDVVQPFRVFPNQPVTINLKTDTTLGSGTSQEGIVTVAPFVKTAVMKSFAESCIIFHVHADLSHADDIFRYNMQRVSNLGQ